AGLLLGRAAVLTTLARHPLARAMRADKLTLAALEATLTGGPTPVTRSLNADVESLRRRTVELAAALDAETIAHDGRVGGGGAPEVPLPGWAIRLPEHAAEALRTGTPPIVTRVRAGICLLDLRGVRESADEAGL